MTLEEEMKLWEERENDEVSKLINLAYNETKDIIYSYTDEFGIEHNPIKSVLAMYGLYGNVKFSIRELKNILHNYDICNFDNVENSNKVELAKKIVKFEKTLK